jgi:Ca2+-binding RTX toxin-like protein
VATLTDINKTPISGYTYIDALLDVGPDWNYLTPAGNTIFYTFAVDSGNESNVYGQQAFSYAQQKYTRLALAYVSEITGIKLVETSFGEQAQIHFAAKDISGVMTTGLTSWNSNFVYTKNEELVDYGTNAYVYLDNAEWYGQNSNLAPGGTGYETLLHELGHVFGLKHPFEGGITLPLALDSTANTLMSYKDVGGPYMTFSQYDLAALDWLYGRDGLRGALGINSADGGRYLTGTSLSDTLSGTNSNDKFEGNAGNDTLNGGAGADTAVFKGVSTAYEFGLLGNGAVVVSDTSGMDGRDVIFSVENAQFSDGVFSVADLVNQANVIPLPPGALTISGTAGNDTFLATDGSVLINGGDGLDELVYNTPRTNYTFSRSGTSFIVSDIVGSGKTSILNGIERLVFSDTSIALDLNGTAGQIYRLYQAAFDREPDSAGLGFWISAMDHGVSLVEVAANFIRSSEFSNRYGASLSNEMFVDNLYHNILGREPEQMGFDYWINVLQEGKAERDSVLIGFSESLENQVLITGAIVDGIVYLPYAT